MTSVATSSSPATEQLALVMADDTPMQFRLDQRTRTRGLAHVAALRAQLAARHAPPAVTAKRAA